MSFILVVFPHVDGTTTVIPNIAICISGHSRPTYPCNISTRVLWCITPFDHRNIISVSIAILCERRNKNESSCAVMVLCVFASTFEMIGCEPIAPRHACMGSSASLAKVPRTLSSFPRMFASTYITFAPQYGIHSTREISSQSRMRAPRTQAQNCSLPVQFGAVFASTFEMGMNQLPPGMHACATAHNIMSRITHNLLVHGKNNYYQIGCSHKLGIFSRVFASTDSRNIFHGNYRPHLRGIILLIYLPVFPGDSKIVGRRLFG